MKKDLKTMLFAGLFGLLVLTGCTVATEQTQEAGCVVDAWRAGSLEYEPPQLYVFLEPEQEVQVISDGSKHEALEQSLDYDAFLESLNAFGFEFEEAGFYQTGSKVVYIGDERLLIYGHVTTRPYAPPATVSITWEAEVSWFNTSSALRVIYLGEDKEIIAFLNERYHNE